jgi:hypothetical protein
MGPIPPLFFSLITDHFPHKTMIFLHTTLAADSPFWLLHFESLTLARLILHQGGPHVIHIGNGTEPNETAFREFAEAIESMGAGFSAGLTFINQPDPLLATRSAVTLTPLKGKGFAIIKNTSPVLALAYTEEAGPLGPVWKETPEPLSRDFLVSQLLDLAQLQTEVRLETISPHARVPALWLERPDTLADA